MQHTARARDELCQIFRLATFYRCIEFPPGVLVKIYIYIYIYIYTHTHIHTHYTRAYISTSAFSFLSQCCYSNEQRLSIFPLRYIGFKRILMRWYFIKIESLKFSPCHGSKFVIPLNFISISVGLFSAAFVLQACLVFIQLFCFQRFIFSFSCEFLALFFKFYFYFVSILALRVRAGAVWKFAIHDFTLLV